jgi:2-methylcitrate dehydratase PrpD
MKTTPGIVRQLAEVVDTLDYESMPPTVIHKARRCVLDTVGVTVAAASARLLGLDAAVRIGDRPR